LNLVAILTAILNNILPALFKYLITKKHYLVLLIALFILIGGIVAASSYFYDNSNFEKSEKFNKISKEAIDQISPCKNGFMATIGVVSTKPTVDKNNNEWHDARFIFSSAAVDGIVVDLTNSSIYSENYKVDSNTYKFFTRLGKDNVFPAKFDLIESPQSINQYSTLRSFLENTDWGSSKTIQTLYLTAIINKNPFAFLPFSFLNDKVIYVISFTTNTKFSTNDKCNEIAEKLRNFNLKIKNYE
jgi:hypothetical protein